MSRAFLLSPAKVTGARAKLLLNPGASFALARQFRSSGLSLAEVFSFASGLYFRGKISYARAFADERRGDVIRIITSNRGLVGPDVSVQPGELESFGGVDIHEDDPRYRVPLLHDSKQLAAGLGSSGAAILLGSVATPKYRDVLLECFGDRLLFPLDFVGRGDMSRGALLLRAARDGQELQYAPVLGAVYRGKRAAGVGKKRP